MRRSSVTLVAAMLAATFALPARAQLDAPALMREGNSLSRAGLYRAAALRYDEARARGLDSALLDYNVGVNQFGAGDYEAAERSLLAARREPALAALAGYNLGLVARAAGRDDDARQWFDTAVVESSSRDLRSLARAAAASVAENPAAADAAGPPARERAQPRERGGRAIPLLEIALDAGYGHDDNANATPGEPYVDLAQPGQPLVTPVPVAASYIPVELMTRYLIPNESGDTNFHVGYRLDGRYYYDSDFANNVSTQRIELGASSLFARNDKRKRTLDSAFFVDRHFQRNFDLDDGIDRDIAGFDISQRFTYTAAGIQGDFDHYLGKWRWGLDMHFERREHERMPVVANYDNEIYYFGTSAGFALNGATTLSLDLRNYRRIFDERLSRGLDGVMLSTNPALEYDYESVEIGLERRLMRWLELDFRYASIDRTDAYLGYDDYTLERVRLDATIRPNSRFALTLGAVSRVYDFPNAFAFNDASAGAKTLDDVSAEVLVEFDVSPRFRIFAELGSDDVTSTDTRAEHSRTRTVVGVTWRH